MTYPPTEQDIRNGKIVQDIYDSLGAEDPTFSEALSILDDVREILEAKMRHRHIIE